jgi:hypothetical protein
MGDKTKQWRQSRRQETQGVDDAELLYLQGLIRCQVCDITYPNFLENCPQCKAKSI